MHYSLENTVADESITPTIYTSHCNIWVHIAFLISAVITWPSPLPKTEINYDKKESRWWETQQRGPTYLSFYIGCLVWSGSGQNAGVAEARTEQHDHNEEEEHTTDGWNGRAQVRGQERTAGRGRSEILVCQDNG